MDEQWLRLLVELADRGTLRAAAAATGYSTSAVSQQLAALQRATGHPLVEPSGRRLALTPAGRALLPHARSVLATLTAARGDLDPEGSPAGEVRLAGFATALVEHVVPALPGLRRRHPRLTVTLQEREPDEVTELLATDAVDVGLVYEYSLLPHGTRGVQFNQAAMSLVVPSSESRGLAELLADPAVGWITNSRAADDDELLDRVAARLDVRPRIAHRIDSLDLVARLVAQGLGVALIASTGPVADGVRYVDLAGAAGVRRGYAITRPGRETWRANAALIEAIVGDRKDWSEKSSPPVSGSRPAVRRVGETG